MNLAENIRLVRKKWGENQDDFSNRFGMTRSNLSRIESGEVDLSLANCRLLSELTGISMNRLMDEQLTLEDIPPLPVGEGGEKFLDRSEPREVKGERDLGDLGDLADLRNLVAVVRELQMDVSSLRKLKNMLDEEGRERLKVFEAIQLMINYLEQELQESGEHSEEKKAYLDQLAALLSGV